jgi:butyryl-CoA dehydrogenase
MRRLFLDYLLTEQQKTVRNLARKIAEGRILPVRAELDEKEDFPWEIMKFCADAGLFGVCIEEEFGGFGGGQLENCLAVEELSRVSWAMASQNLGTAFLSQSIPTTITGLWKA